MIAEGGLELSVDLFALRCLIENVAEGVDALDEACTYFIGGALFLPSQTAPMARRPLRARLVRDATPGAGLKLVTALISGSTEVRGRTRPRASASSRVMPRWAATSS